MKPEHDMDRLKSSYVREQKRYTRKDISQSFKLNNEDTIKFIKTLKAYGVLKTVKRTLLEKDLTELTDSEIEIVNEEDISEEYFYVFVFVGVLTVGNIIIKCYPKYISSAEQPLSEMKQVLGVLKKYNSKEQIINLYNGETEQNSFNLLATILYIFNDYSENGLYTNYQDSVETLGEGEILWDKTINETFAVISNNRPFYPDLQTRVTITDESDYIRRLHQCILTECFIKVKNANLADLFDLEEIDIYDGDLTDFGDNEYILYRLEKEIGIQYNTRKQSLLKTMYAYIAHCKTIESGFGISMYGTSNYNMVWEKVCAQVMGNDLNTKLSKLPIPIADGYSDRKEKTIYEIIEKPLWRPCAGEGKKHRAEKTLKPDIVTIYKVNEEYCFGIFDAKYYNIQLNEKGVSNQPGVEDITKQYLYQLAYQDFITSHGFKYVQNAFLFPSENNDVESLGQVEMSMFHNMGDTQLINILVVKLPAIKIYELYLTNQNFTGLEEEIGGLPINYNA